MQVSGTSSYNSANYISSNKNKATVGAASFASTTSDDKLSSAYNPLLENLLKVDSVQKFVTVSDDGTYSFNWTVKDGGLNSQQMVARDLIDAANAWGSWTPPSTSRYTQSDLDLFRQSTGYNLILTEEFGEMIVDDNGNAPAPGDTAKVEAAWQLMGAIGYARSSEAISGDISLDNLPEILNLFGTANLDENVVRNMLKDFMATLGASADDISHLESSGQIGHEGEQIYTWRWQRSANETATLNVAATEASDLAEALKYLSA